MHFSFSDFFEIVRTCFSHIREILVPECHFAESTLQKWNQKCNINQINLKNKTIVTFKYIKINSIFFSIIFDGLFGHIKSKPGVCF